MTLGISNILNIPSNGNQAQAGKKNKSQNSEFVFEFQGQEYSYKSKAEFMEDIADGKIDDGNTSFISKMEKFAKDLPLVGGLFEAYDRNHEGKTESEALKETETADSENKSETAEHSTATAQQNINSIDKDANTANEKTAEDEKVIDEKEQEIDELKEEIKEQEKLEQATKEKEMKQAADKAEKEYDPAKHGDSKEAYIDRQVAGLMNTGKTKSAELKDQLKIAETDVKNLFSGIANRNKINRQNNFTKLSMNVQSTFSTAATADEKNYQEQLATLDVAA